MNKENGMMTLEIHIYDSKNSMTYLFINLSIIHQIEWKALSVWN